MTSSDHKHIPPGAKTLVIVTGPTGVGKSDLALSIAEQYDTPIISADSRQIYRGMAIGTDAPTPEMLSRVPHHFIATREVTEHYSASQYEQDALKVISQVHQEKDVALMVGGSMMYIDAVAKGIDDIPDVSPEVRTKLWQEYEEVGVSELRERLQAVDPEYLRRIDHNNHKRIIHALEVYTTTGKPFSAFHTGKTKKRPFTILKFGIIRDREELYQRINNRVTSMVEHGLIEEAHNLLPFRHLNALNTVGYKEAFEYLDGTVTIDECIRRIAKNTRTYARKQLTWYRRDPSMIWLHPDDLPTLLRHISSQLP